MKVVTREEKFFKKHGFHISYDAEYLGEIENLSREESIILEREMRKMDRNVRGTLARLKKLAAKYKGKPMFKLLVAMSYANLDQEDKKRQICREILAERPDYISATTEIMRSLNHEEKFDEFIDFVGEDLSISNHKSDNTFHVTEILSFYDQIFYYLFSFEKDKEKAAEVLEILKDADIDSEETQHCIEGYEILCQTEIVEAEVIKEIAERIGKPFNFPKEINAIYCYELSDGHLPIKNLLALPREKVIEDLEMVLRDGLDNYKYWQSAYYNRELEEEDLQFVLHATFLLTELKSKKSIEIVWEILQSDSRISDFYFDDHVTETLWLDFYLLAKDDIPFLKKCLLTENLVSFSASPVYVSIGQIIHNEPHRRGEFLTLFEEVIDTLLERKKEGIEVDETMVTLMLHEGVDIGLVELENRILLLDKAELIDESIASANDLIDDLKNGESDFRKLTIHSDIYARYEEQRKIIENFEKRHKLLMEEEIIPISKMEVASNPLPVKKSTKKVGRNDPCPCGSGKKYKKCCLNK